MRPEREDAPRTAHTKLAARDDSVVEQEATKEARPENVRTPGPTGRLVGWALSNPGIALTVSGIVIYGVLNLYLSLLYGPLGVSPSQVGFGYQETLTSSVALLALGLAAYAVLAIATVGVRRVLSWGRVRRGDARAANVGAWDTPSWLKLAFLVFAVSYVFGLLLTAHLASKAIQAGRVPTQTTEYFGVPVVARLPQPAYVSATSARVPLPANIANLKGSCVFYLGSADGFAVFYASRDGRTVRVPSSIVAIDVGGDVQAGVCE